MYTPTQNFGLAMLDYGDEADIGVINDMVTMKVDELLFQNRAISAPPFETTEAYTEGDLVVYENVLYRFTADKAAGAWDSSKVVQTSLAAEIESKGSGGASALSDLTDTDIDSPANGEVLTWDGSAWVNAEGTPTITKTASGNPIEITDGADAPMVKCVTEIMGYQSGTGTPSPDNVRPITAYTEGEIEVSDGDGNTTTHTTTYPSAIYRGSEDVVNGEVTKEWVKAVFSGSSSEAWDYNSSNQAFFCVNGLTDPFVDNTKNDFALSNMAEQLRYNAVGGSEMVDGKFCIGMSGANNILYFKNTNYSSVADFKTWLSTNNLEIAYRLATTTTSSVTPTNLPIKSLSGYNHIESSTGEMTIDYITEGYQPLVDLIQSEDASLNVFDLWTNTSGASTGTFALSAPIDDFDFISFYYGVYSEYTSSPNIADSRMISVKELKALHESGKNLLLTGYSQRVVYIDAYDSSVTVSMTGDSQVLLAVKGIKIDGGGSSGTNQHTYSTQEQVVGKWIDGKDIYEKTYTFSSLPSVADWTAFDEDCGIDTLVDYSLMYTRSNGQIDNSDDLLRVAYNPPNALGDLCYYPGGVGATHITVRYTKATTTIRSLSKGSTDSLRAEISEVKGEGDELTATDEKAVKKAQSEDTETKEADETEGNADEMQDETVTE